MSVIKTEDLMDTIRSKVGIYIDDKNRNKLDFFKDELLLIIAKLSMLENEAKKNSDNAKLISETVNSVFNEKLVKGA